MRVPAQRILRVAARVSVKVEEEGELDWCAAAGAVAVIGAVAGVPALRITVDRVIALVLLWPMVKGDRFVGLDGFLTQT